MRSPYHTTKALDEMRALCAEAGIDVVEVADHPEAVTLPELADDERKKRREDARGRALERGTAHRGRWGRLSRPSSGLAPLSRA